MKQDGERAVFLMNRALFQKAVQMTTQAWYNKK